MDDVQPHKPHRGRLSGGKAAKKLKKSSHSRQPNQRNPKAFTFQSAVRAARSIHRLVYHACFIHDIQIRYRLAYDAMNIHLDEGKLRGHAWPIFFQSIEAITNWG